MTSLLVSVKCLYDITDESVERVERSVVDVGEIGPCGLRLVCQQTSFALVQPVARPLGADLRRGRDHDDCVEPVLRPGLVQEWHLVDGQGRRVREPGELFAPGIRARHHLRMEELLEPRELPAVGEDDRADGGPDHLVTVEDALPVALAKRRLDLFVLVELVYDLVARDRGGAVPRESLERLALAGADPARDRDSERLDDFAPRGQPQ